MIAHLRIGAVVAAMAVASMGASAQASTTPLSLNYLSNTTFLTGTRYEGQLVAGLSGIDYDPASGTFIAVRDNVISNVRPAAFTLAATNVTNQGYSLAFTGVNTLGGAAQLNGLESIRYDPSGNGLWLTSEAPNAVYHIDANGVRRSLTLDASVAGRTPAGASNYGLEGMTFTPEGSLWVSRENSLSGDATNIIRLSQLGSNGELQSQFAYTLDTVLAPNRNGMPIANPPGTGVGNNGVTEILALSETSFLVMERAFDGIGNDTTGTSHNSIRIYQIDLQGATNVSGITNLNDPAAFSAVEKRLVFDSQSLAGVLNTYDTRVDNIEGMSFGATLPDGTRTLVLVSDNNNSNSQRKTQFLVFGVQGGTAAVPEPASWAMLIGGFGLVGTAMRRRRANAPA